ncbi:DUF815 domain-containing protein [Sphingomonas oligophenolica]|uniref:DUF815 domain-containing protein n=1 Tax=Sphingomonas oligophenolica TaxID=301154 RepID=A0A502CPH7_9SPHN|nr:DUF815 domain-containing protein [Sphingomonas oligophenolica]TPG15545.1 DUF815 domain-containing protein [Sphingomonas oligophenolica]
MTEDYLRRIADALDRLAPPPAATADLAAHPAYVWRRGGIAAARNFAPLPVDLLIGIDRQKAALVENWRRHAAWGAAHDVLLWGARGSGKSALVKSALAQVRRDGGDIALIDVATHDDLPALFALLGDFDRRFVLFLDDLGFDGTAGARWLRSLLDGGAEARPDNVRLAVTSNRRHLLPRDIAEQASAINPRDAVDDQLALADRFGLALGFHALDQDGYLAIVAAYAAHYAVQAQRDDALEWAIRRGSRSGRVAWQYIVDAAGRAGQRLHDH